MYYKFVKHAELLEALLNGSNLNLANCIVGYGILLGSDGSTYLSNEVTKKYLVDFSFY